MTDLGRDNFELLNFTKVEVLFSLECLKKLGTLLSRLSIKTFCLPSVLWQTEEWVNAQVLPGHLQF